MFKQTTTCMPKDFTDQMGRKISLPATPKRIVSIVPSQTELLYDLGLSENIVGITWFCIHPAHHFNATEKVGGTKKLNFDKIRALQPDLIIGNKEENEKSQIEALEKEFPVWMSDINTLEDALVMIKMLGDVTETGEKAHDLCGDIIDGFAQLSNSNIYPTRAAYIIWRNPYIGASSNTFINEMLQQCGMVNVLDGFIPKNSDNESLRYPMFSIEELKELAPEVVLLSSEPFPFKEKHIREIKEVLPNAEVLLVDGEMFSWYGSRLTQSPAYFSKLLENFQVPVYV